MGKKSKAKAKAKAKAKVFEKNVGGSNYAEHKIQPWHIWVEWKLDPFRADIIKRTLRTKKGDDVKMDYEKIIHICEEIIRQIDEGIWKQ